MEGSGDPVSGKSRPNGALTALFEEILGAVSELYLSRKRIAIRVRGGEEYNYSAGRKHLILLTVSISFIEVFNEK